MNLFDANGNVNRKVVIALSVLLPLVFYFIFQSFFPANGKLGEDYSLFFPSMLDGVFWHHVNGLSKVPWFTPSFGGGVPKFPNPQSVYYSVEQFLCFVTDPLTSIKITLLLFAVLGFIGLYLLLKRIFLLSAATSLLGATLFLFNGFFISRMIIGHITFHTIMLFPMFIYFGLLHTKKNEKPGIRKLAADILFAALIFIYMIYSGAFYIIPPLMLGLSISALIYNLLIQPAFSYRTFILKSFCIVLVSVAAGAAYLNATFSYTSLFPRDTYTLPGVPHVMDLLQLWFRALFLNSPYEYAKEILVGRMWYIGPHEMDFAIGLFPLLILVTAAAFLIKQISSGQLGKWFNFKSAVKILFLLVLLTVPLALNFYTPAWNAFMKSLPFVKSSSSNFRWFCMYIPVLILLTCIALEKITWLAKYRFYIMAAGILFVVFSNIFKDRTAYTLDYNPKIILEAYDDLNAGKLKPEIAWIDEAVMKVDYKVISNDVMALGSSQLKPYEPIFGYHIENFPKKSLVSGSVMQVNADGFLNLKNPAGYVFPDENNIKPGDHFRADEAEKAERFRRYREFPFKFSASQKLANSVTLFSLGALALYLVFYAVQGLSSLIPLKKKVAVKPVVAAKKKRK